MKSIIKIIGVIGIVVLLFILYPYYVQYTAQYLNLANSIYTATGHTMSSLETMFFSALPLIGLILIFWIGYKIITGRRSG